MARNHRALAKSGAKGDSKGERFHGRARCRGRGRGGGLAQRPEFNHLADPDLRGFTLADEARQTSRQDRSAFWGDNLRNNPVPFVSSGPIEPLKQLQKLLQDVKLDDCSDDTRPGEQTYASASVGDEQHQPVDTPTEPLRIKVPTLEDSRLPAETSKIIGPEELEMAINAETFSGTKNPPFFFDTTRNGTNTGFSIPQKSETSSKQSSPVSSHRSDEDVILFKGRNTKSQATGFRYETSALVRDSDLVIAEQALDLQLPYVSKRKKRRGRRGGQKLHVASNRSPSEDDSDDAILADYIANIEESHGIDDLILLGKLNQRDLGGDNRLSNSEATHRKKKLLTMTPSNDFLAEEHLGDVSSNNGQKNDNSDHILATQNVGFNLNLNASECESDPPSKGLDLDIPRFSDKILQYPDMNGFYDDFDFGLWERPSTHQRRKGKGKSAQPDLEISDIELRQSVQEAFQNDRFKKAQRKKQREELRALGLLGKSMRPDDLRVKYPKGMTIIQVAEEIRSFLLGSDQAITFPPMDKHARKIIHEMANKVNLQSKSTGKGDERRPTLYRTKRTAPYNETSFNTITARVHRKYLTRSDQKGAGRKGPGPTQRASLAAVTLADGEIVGGFAPELGIENRGRNMLEKMGWSEGTALGATHNKGILEPVMQAMKKSKAGLG